MHQSSGQEGCRNSHGGHCCLLEMGSYDWLSSNTSDHDPRCFRVVANMEEESRNFGGMMDAL